MFNAGGKQPLKSLLIENIVTLSEGISNNG